MPNRIIKESICTSEEIASLSPYAEILFYRLMVKADDHGLYFGNERIIKNTCFPMKSDDIKINQLQSWLEELQKAKLIFFYIADDGKKYLKLTSWEKHQQIRAQKSKFPLPTPSDINGNQLISIASKCPRNPIQSNPIQSESNTESETIIAPSDLKSPDAETEPPEELFEFGFILKDNTMFYPTVGCVKEFQEAYPALNIELEIKQMGVWCKNNVGKRKTRRGANSFMVGWLDKSQNKPNLRANTGKIQSADEDIDWEAKNREWEERQRKEAQG